MDERRRAKARLVTGMLSGRPWAEAAADAGVRTSRTAAYRLCRAMGERGDAALADGRRGHASKLRPPIRAWLEEYCREAPSASGVRVQAALREQFDLDVSVRHINRVRAALGVGAVSPPDGWRGRGGGCGLAPAPAARVGMA